MVVNNTHCRALSPIFKGLDTAVMREVSSRETFLPALRRAGNRKQGANGNRTRDKVNLPATFFAAARPAVHRHYAVVKIYARLEKRTCRHSCGLRLALLNLTFCARRGRNPVPRSAEFPGFPLSRERRVCIAGTRGGILKNNRTIFLATVICRFHCLRT